MFFGCHLSASGGNAAMVKTALSIGANTFAFFTRNPRGSKAKKEDSADAAKAVFDGINQAAKESGVFVAAQCCEHLNRAIIIERAAAPHGEEVNVVPQPKAGGSFATAAYAAFDDPVALEEIRADAGIDIGFTMIGMHLKRVAVPVRLENDRIGEAKVLAARVRPKFIGGSRACYDDNKL